MQNRQSARLLLGLSLSVAALAPSAARAACGDGALEPTELCDDGNVITGDGCNAGCQSEAGYICQGSPSLCCFGEVASGYALQGNASLDARSGEVTLTPDLNNQVGVAWFRQTLDFTRPFTVTLRLYLGARDNDPGGTSSDGGADGIAVLFQRDPRGLMAAGAIGGELGAQGISPVLGVEFDTFNNAAAYGDVTAGDEDHVSVFHTRTTPASNHIAQAVCLNDGPLCQNYEDGRYHVYDVEWTGDQDQRLRVRVDGALRVELMRDLVGQYFADNPSGIYFGLAASTGNSRNLHKFCPAAPAGYIVPRDSDGDGVDDSVDLDDDNDGRSDLDETAMLFPESDPGDDHDRDGVPNHRDRDYWEDVAQREADCPDLMAPIGACDSYPRAVDFDGDGLADHLDPDSDGDGVSDAEEDGGSDADRDGKLDGCAPAPETGVCPRTRPPPPDMDGDGAIDSRDPDTDADGALDMVDPARLDPCVPSASLLACGRGDADGDGLPNVAECADPRQCPDSDGDGTADYQEPDQDEDGALDGVDPAPRDPCSPRMETPACATGDADGDGSPNGSECPDPSQCPDSNLDGTPDYQDPDQDRDGTVDGPDSAPQDPCVPRMELALCMRGDSDGDGLPNGSECPDPSQCPDSNLDGTPDYQDPDQDRDGSQDGMDGAPRDPCRPLPNVLACASGDADGDRLDNGYECSGLMPDRCRDSDGDRTPDYLDPDSDGDGVDDRDECSAASSCGEQDEDEDGTPDLLDPDRPEVAGGACSASASPGSEDLGLGWLLALLIASLLGRRWRRV